MEPACILAAAWSRSVFNRAAAATVGSTATCVNIFPSRPEDAISCDDTLPSILASASTEETSPLPMATDLRTAAPRKPA